MHWHTLNGAAPRIIAHRGASGLLPEHSLPGYRLAAEQGADVIEPDLVVSRDGELFVHHDLWLDSTTDVATRPEFAACAVDHDGQRDWGVADFTAAELSSLRLRQRWPQRDHGHDGRYGLPSYAAMLDLLTPLRGAGGRPFITYPEIKHPAFFRARGHDPVALLAGLLKRRGLAGPKAPVWIQCFDGAVLHEAWSVNGNRCFGLVEDAEGTNWTQAIADLRGWASGIAPDKALLWDADGRSTGRLEQAHAAGLEVHAWTFRDDMNTAPFAAIDELLRAALSLGVDALFCDFPATALEVRASME